MAIHEIYENRIGKGRMMMLMGRREMKREGLEKEKKGIGGRGEWEWRGKQIK